MCLRNEVKMRSNIIIFLPVAAPSVRSGGCTGVFGLGEAHWHYTAEFFGFTIPLGKGWINNLTRFWLYLMLFFGFTWFWYPHGAALVVAEVTAAADLLALANSAANRARSKRGTTVSALQASFQLRPLYYRFLTVWAAVKSVYKVQISEGDHGSVSDQAFNYHMKSWFIC